MADNQSVADALAGVDAEFDPLLLDHQLCFPLYAATNLLQRLYRPLLAPLGLTYSQYLVMLALWERSPVTVSELRTRLHLDNGTVTPLLKRMEQGGFLTRRRDDGDERRVLIDLTPHGRALRERAKGVPGALASCIALDYGEAVSLHGLTTALVRKIGDDLSKAGARRKSSEEDLNR
jgi:DNA-binding MarR family transcriptional regulator